MPEDFDLNKIKKALYVPSFHYTGKYSLHLLHITNHVHPGMDGEGIDVEVAFSNNELFLITLKKQITLDKYQDGF